VVLEGWRIYPPPTCSTITNFIFEAPRSILLSYSAVVIIRFLVTCSRESVVRDFARARGYGIEDGRCLVNKIKPVVLVVGRSAAWRQPMIMVLQRCGYVTLEASDGFEALQAAIDNRIDLLVSGDEMAGLSGRELVGIIKRHDAIARCILISESPAEADGLPENVEFLGAPFGPEEFLGKVMGNAV
jgi:CheY-like chemotaxis protein